MFRFSQNTTPQTADATDYHIDLHSSFGCLHQLINDPFISQGIDLDSDVGCFSLFCHLDFSIDQIQNRPLQTLWRHQEMLGLIHSFSQKDRLEYLQCFLSDLLVRCDQRKICIQSRRFFIIIAGSNLGDVLDLISVFSGDQTYFGMNLQAINPINHMTSGILQSPAPFNIIFLIKTGL